MKKLEEAGCRLNPKKGELFKEKAEWIGHKIDENGIRPLQENMEAIKKLKTLKKKEIKVLPGSNTIPVKVYRKPVSTNRFTTKIA